MPESAALRGQLIHQGANARDAFVFEHVEIAALPLLEELAQRAGDAETAAIAVRRTTARLYSRSPWTFPIRSRRRSRR